MNYEPSENTHSQLNTSEIAKLLKNIGRVYLQTENHLLDEWKQKLHVAGFEGIQDSRPLLPKINHKAIRLHLTDTIIKLSSENPSWSCNRLRQTLKTMNIRY